MTGSEEKFDISDSRFLRVALMIAGTAFLMLGIIGIMIPVLPTTPFLLLAAACFARSSKKVYDRLMSNRLFGDYVRNYREGKGIPLKVKMVSISFLWGFMVISIFLIDILWLSIILILIAVGVTIHLAAIKTLNRQQHSKP